MGLSIYNNIIKLEEDYLPVNKILSYYAGLTTNNSTPATNIQSLLNKMTYTITPDDDEITVILKTADTEKREIQIELTLNNTGEYRIYKVYLNYLGKTSSNYISIILNYNSKSIASLDKYVAFWCGYFLISINDADNKYAALFSWETNDGYSPYDYMSDTNIYIGSQEVSYAILCSEGEMSLYNNIIVKNRFGCFCLAYIFYDDSDINNITRLNLDPESFYYDTNETYENSHDYDDYEDVDRYEYLSGFKWKLLHDIGENDVKLIWNKIKYNNDNVFYMPRCVYFNKQTRKIDKKRYNIYLDKLGNEFLYLCYDENNTYPYSHDVIGSIGNYHYELPMTPIGNTGLYVYNITKDIEIYKYNWFN